MKYSICITNRNSGKSIQSSLLSILKQIDESFEVVIVDSLSNDGSQVFLREIAKQGRIKLIEEKCSRGKGRQLAFENSSGEYIISNIDIDETYKPALKELLNFYNRLCEDKVLAVTNSANS